MFKLCQPGQDNDSSIKLHLKQQLRLPDFNGRNQANQYNYKSQSLPQQRNSATERSRTVDPPATFDASIQSFNSPLKLKNSTCSRLTLTENFTMGQQISRADNIRKSRDKGEDIPEVDTEKEFQQADKQLNEMHMILKRLIPENDLHSKITRHKPVQIFVIPDNLMTYKIPCRKEPSPCKITIKYLDKKIEGIDFDLKVWVSLTETNPHDQKCDQKLCAPTSILVVDPEKKSTFRTHFNIYVTFYSKEGANIKVSAKFIDVNEFRKKNLKALNTNDDTEKKEDPETERISKELLDGYERSRPKWTTNFIETNRLNASQRLPQIVQPWAERQTLADVRRESFNLQRKKVRLAFSIKWAYVRKRRAELLVVQDKTRDKLNRATTLCHAMVFFTNYKKLFDNMAHKIMILRKKRDMKLKALLMIRRLKTHLTRHGQEYDDRI